MLLVFKRLVLFAIDWIFEGQFCEARKIFKGIYKIETEIEEPSFHKEIRLVVEARGCML